MDNHQHHAAMSFADRDMLKPLVLLAAILEFMMDAFTMFANSINNDLNEFLDPENMGLDTDIMSIYASHTDI
jgi:hypothetical protein